MDEKSRLYEEDISQLKNFIEIWKEFITSVEEYMNQQPESYEANIDGLLNFANKLRQKEKAEFYEDEEAKTVRKEGLDRRVLEEEGEGVCTIM